MDNLFYYSIRAKRQTFSFPVQQQIGNSEMISFRFRCFTRITRQPNKEKKNWRQHIKNEAHQSFHRRVSFLRSVVIFSIRNHTRRTRQNPYFASSDANVASGINHPLTISLLTKKRPTMNSEHGSLNVKQLMTNWLISFRCAFSGSCESQLTWMRSR